MKIGDVMALKLAGYSIDDIKKITVMAGSDPEVISVAKQVKSMDELESLAELSEVNAQAPPSNDKVKGDPEADGENENSPELSEQLEAEKNKVKELEQQLHQAQQLNLRKDNSNNAEDVLKKAEDQVIDFINNL